MAATGPLKLLLHLPPSFSSLDIQKRWAKIMKICPACGSLLVSFREKHGEVQRAGSKTGTVGGGNRTAAPAADGLHKQPFNEERITSWYCSKCGVHMIPEQENPAYPKKEVRTKRASTGSMLSGSESSGMSAKPPLVPRQTSLQSKRRSENVSRESILNAMAQHSNDRASKELLPLKNGSLRGSLSSSSPQSPGSISTIIDNTYIEFERGIQDGITTLLNHIRNHVVQKEGQLKAYQVGMLQRERTLKANEQDFVVRITRLEQSEKSLKNKRERLQIYKDSMMYQLDAKAKQLAKFEKKIQWTHPSNDVTDLSIQNDSSGLTSNSSANPALPPRQIRDISWNQRQDQSVAEGQKDGYPGRTYIRSQSSAIVNDGKTSYHPHQQRYSNGSTSHTFRLSFTGPSSNNISLQDKNWKDVSHNNPVRTSTHNVHFATEQNGHPESGTVIPESNEDAVPVDGHTGVLHVDTGYYSVRDGEQRRSGSHGSSAVTQNTSTSSLLQVDDERWRQQQQDGTEHAPHTQRTNQQQNLLSHEQLDRKYFPINHEVRRSYDLTQQPMKESPRQAWMRSRNKIEAAQQHHNIQQQNGIQQNGHIGNGKGTNLPSDRQQSLQTKSWNSSPNLAEAKQFNASYDELPESQRLNSSYDGYLEPLELRRDASRDSHLERNISVEPVVVTSPSSPPPVYNGHGPPLPVVPPPTQPGKPYNPQTVFLNGYSHNDTHEDSYNKAAAGHRHRYSTNDYFSYNSRNASQSSPGSRAYYEEKLAPRHARRVTEL